MKPIFKEGKWLCISMRVSLQVNACIEGPVAFLVVEEYLEIFLFLKKPPLGSVAQRYFSLSE